MTNVASNEAKRRNRDAAFWGMTDRAGECWVWTGARSGRRDGGNDYGHIIRNGRHVKAHRVAYERAVGPIPAGMQVMHTCDNPPCIRPDHLRLGTHADNMADMVAKGRSPRTRHPGESNPAAVLTEDAVRVIRQSHESTQVLARRFGVSPSSVRDVQRGATWKSVA